MCQTGFCQQPMQHPTAQCLLQPACQELKVKALWSACASPGGPASPAVLIYLRLHSCLSTWEEPRLHPV